MESPEPDPAGADAGVSVPLLSARLRGLLVAGLLAALAYLSLASDPAGPGGRPVGHALGYAGLALVLAYALARWRAPAGLKWAAVFGLAVGYGGLMEALQVLRPGRGFELADLAVNALAAAVGACWCWLEPRVAYRRVGPVG